MPDSPQLYGNHMSHLNVHLQHSHLCHDVPHTEGELAGDDGAQLLPLGGAGAGVLEEEGKGGGSHSQAES